MSIVLNIQRFSIHDGPGIRTVVFIKGCPLRCLWCSNPESQNAFPEVVYRDSRCTRCAKCVEICEVQAISLDADRININRKTCTLCGKCIEVCVAGALDIYGKEMTVDEAFREVVRDKSFYQNSGGGVTASGGEALSQPDFVAELFKQCQDVKIHTCLETCGYAGDNDWDKVLPYTNLVLFDVKLMAPLAHQQVTGKSNERILNNLKLVDASGVPVIIRIPVIPGINDSEDNIMQIAHYIKNINCVKEVHLLPYHKYGESKYKHLHRKYHLGSLEPPDDAHLEKLVGLFKDMDIGAKIVN